MTEVYYGNSANAGRGGGYLTDPDANYAQTLPAGAYMGRSASMIGSSYSASDQAMMGAYHAREDASQAIAFAAMPAMVGGSRAMADARGFAASTAPFFGVPQAQDYIPQGASFGQSLSGALNIGPSARQITDSQYRYYATQDMSRRISMGATAMIMDAGIPSLAGEVGYYGGSALGALVGSPMIGGLAGAALLGGTASMVSNMDGVRRHTQNMATAESMSGRFMTSAVSSHAMGRGSSRSQQREVSSFLEESSLGDMFFKPEEISQMFQGGTSRGIFDAVRSTEDFKKRFTDMKESLKTIMQTLHQSMEEGMDTMGMLNNTGIRTSGQIRSFMGNVQSSAGLSGVSVGTATQHALMGAEAFRGTGINMSVGANLALDNLSMVGAQAGRNLLPQELLRQMGGVTGMANAMTGIQTHALSNNPQIQRMLMGAFGQGGQLDQGHIQRFISGEASSFEMAGKATGQLLQGSTNALAFMGARPELINQLPSEVRAILPMVAVDDQMRQLQKIMPGLDRNDPNTLKGLAMQMGIAGSHNEASLLVEQWQNFQGESGQQMVADIARTRIRQTLRNGDKFPETMHFGRQMALGMQKMRHQVDQIGIGMYDSIDDSVQDVFRSLRGQGRVDFSELTDARMRQMQDAAIARGGDSYSRSSGLVADGARDERQDLERRAAQSAGFDPDGEGASNMPRRSKESLSQLQGLRRQRRAMEQSALTRVNGLRGQRERLYAGLSSGSTSVGDQRDILSQVTDLDSQISELRGQATRGDYSNLMNEEQLKSYQSLGQQIDAMDDAPMSYDEIYSRQDYSQRTKLLAKEQLAARRSGEARVNEMILGLSPQGITDRIRSTFSFTENNRNRIATMERGGLLRAGFNKEMSDLHSTTGVGSLDSVLASTDANPTSALAYAAAKLQGNQGDINTMTTMLQAQGMDSHRMKFLDYQVGQTDSPLNQRARALIDMRDELVQAQTGAQAMQDAFSPGIDRLGSAQGRSQRIDRSISAVGQSEQIRTTLGRLRMYAGQELDGTTRAEVDRLRGELDSGMSAAGVEGKIGGLLADVVLGGGAGSEALNKFMSNPKDDAARSEVRTAMDGQVDGHTKRIEQAQKVMDGVMLRGDGALYRNLKDSANLSLGELSASFAQGFGEGGVAGGAAGAMFTPIGSLAGGLIVGSGRGLQRALGTFMDFNRTREDRSAQAQREIMTQYVGQLQKNGDKRFSKELVKRLKSGDAMAMKEVSGMLDPGDKAALNKALVQTDHDPASYDPADLSRNSLEVVMKMRDTASDKFYEGFSDSISEDGFFGTDDAMQSAMSFVGIGKQSWVGKALTNSASKSQSELALDYLNAVDRGEDPAAYARALLDADLSVDQINKKYVNMSKDGKPLSIIDNKRQKDVRNLLNARRAVEDKSRAQQVDAVSGGQDFLDTVLTSHQAGGLSARDSERFLRATGESDGSKLLLKMQEENYRPSADKNADEYRLTEELFSKKELADGLSEEEIARGMGRQVMKYTGTTEGSQDVSSQGINQTTIQALKETVESVRSLHNVVNELAQRMATN